MTAEVVVMNRLGIALASDSAASVASGNRTKLYHADKLFMLSGTQPVAAMIYNNSSLLDVPWETIVKLYRAKLASSKFERLENYAADLIDYLSGNDDLFPPETQKKGYLNTLRGYFRGLERAISREVLRRAIQDGSDGPSVVAEAIDRILNDSVQTWANSPDHVTDGFPADTGRNVVGRYSGEVYQVISEVFETYRLGAVHQTKLFEIARHIIQKERVLPDSYAGLVIAGFGDKDHFPVMQSFEIGGIFDQKLKCRATQTVRVNGEQPAAIKAFAQSEEMVDTFLYGASPSLYKTITEQVLKVVLGMPDVIIDGIPRVGKARKAAYKAQVRDASRDTAIELFRELQKLREKLRYEPVLGSIAHLPKSELAQVAATLVNLSSFQKRVSMLEEETVGGPIDVAVITKGDGFVWVDRKHYFKPELNAHFFSNRYK